MTYERREVTVDPSVFECIRQPLHWPVRQMNDISYQNIMNMNMHEQQPETLSASLVICVPSASILKNINIEIRMIQSRSQQITDC